MKKFLYTIFAAALLASCAKTQDERVADLISHRFDSLALNCELVSVALVDTIYQQMPATDPVYLRTIEICDSLRREELRSNRYLHTDPINPQTVDAISRLVEYMDQYEAPVEFYMYSVIVRSDEHEVKKEVESVVYLVDPDLRGVRTAPINYQDIRQKAQDNIWRDLLIKSL